MKKSKKILALCLSLVLLFAAVGGTLAWLTDKDKAENVFSIGSVDIKLTEVNKVNDTDVTANANGKFEFNNLMPGDVITKTPTITNEGKNDAYVRVVVEVQNTKEHITKLMGTNIDEYYEEQLNYDNTKMEQLYDEIFNGWGINYQKKVGQTMRFWLDQRDGVLAIDAIRVIGGSNNWMFGVDNTFLSGEEQIWKANTPDNCYGYFENNGDCSSYYGGMMAKGEGKLLYVFYLKLDGKTGDTVASYKLFDGLKVPETFDTEQLAFFDGLEINIYADAIQAQGFETWQEAFESLNEQHPLSMWKTATTTAAE